MFAWRYLMFYMKASATPNTALARYSRNTSTPAGSDANQERDSTITSRNKRFILGLVGSDSIKFFSRLGRRQHKAPGVSPGVSIAPLTSARETGDRPSNGRGCRRQLISAHSMGLMPEGVSSRPALAVR